MLIAGIDEAGRGPVIGPLVICGVLIEEKKEQKLRDIKVKDSKLLSPQKREHMFKEIIGLIKDYRAIIILPNEIDEAITSEQNNINWLEATKSAEILNFLQPNKAYIDCPSNNISAYKTYIQQRLLKKNTGLIIAHKADVKYPVVSAASILAKVIRDKEIGKIKIDIGVDFGSGYPSDPSTKRFLKENWQKEEYAHIFRKTWAPFKELQGRKDQKNLLDF